MFKQETDFSHYDQLEIKLRKANDKYLLTICERDTIYQNINIIWLNYEQAELLKFTIGGIDND
jgi:hypothetical protein